MGGTGGRAAGHARGVEETIVDLPITVGQFVKAAGFATTGGEAKYLVTAGQVQVNGEVETRRGHKLVPGDEVEVAGKTARVVARGFGGTPAAPRS